MTPPEETMPAGPRARPTHPRHFGQKPWGLPGGSPEVPFVGGIFDVVADVIEHPVGCGAVSGIKHLEQRKGWW